MTGKIDMQAIEREAKLLPNIVIVSRETWSREIDREDLANSARWLAFKSRSDLRALSRNSDPQEGR